MAATVPGSGDVARLGARREKLRKQLAEVNAELAAAVVAEAAAVTEGTQYDESNAARRARVTRMTIRTWLGKRGS